MQQVEEPGPEVDKQYSVQSDFVNLESIFFYIVTQQFYS